MYSSQNASFQTFKIDHKGTEVRSLARVCLWLLIAAVFVIFG